MTEGSRGFLEGAVGPCTVVDVSRLGGQGSVLQGVDEEGTRWFAKRLNGIGGWRAEVRAYRRWLPALGGHAPLLKAADQRSRSLGVCRSRQPR